ncbi:histone H1-like [Tubulanus polymorphus]|uniref:histone H1-like n=1 Tax=Tubulanus polymorphus TaxID=672921 RepID=UPI003DA2DA7A
MSDAASPKKAAAAAAKKVAKPKAQHPSTAVMVKAAISNLASKTGSSLVAIKNYIEANYKGIDMQRQSRFIRTNLSDGVVKGIYVRHQGKGTGASGSFRLSQDTKKAEKAAAKPKPAKKPAAKKADAAAKKPAAKKKATTAKKTATAKKTKSPAKKAAKPKKAKSPAKKKPAAKSAAKKKTPAKGKKPAKK